MHSSWHLGWTLLHSLWQIGLLGLFTLGLERLLRFNPAQLRHNLLLLMLGGMVLASAYTYSWGMALFCQHPAICRDLTTDASQMLPGALLYSISSESPIQTPVPFLLRCKMVARKPLEAGWFGCWGLAFFSLRLVWNYLALTVLRRNSIQINDAQLDQLLHKVASAIGLRRQVSLRLSTQVQSPLTFGLLCTDCHPACRLPWSPKLRLRYWRHCSAMR